MKKLYVACLAAFWIAACAEVPRTMAPPPQIPGAEFVGDEACAVCHEDLAHAFDGATHAVLRAAGTDPSYGACESCHGPGSLHVASGGDSAAIVAVERSPEACFACHTGTRGDFALPHRHPVTTGPLGMVEARMGCADCHDPHQGSAAAFAAAPMFAADEGCTDCHQAQRGPWVFEHEAMREGCTACHAAHGSINRKMLTETSATLCLKCHTQEQPRAGVALIGGIDHSLFLSQGSCFTAGCHEAVHGSQVSPSLRF